MSPKKHPPIIPNKKIEEVTIHYKSHGKEYWLVLKGSQTVAIVADQGLASWIAKEMDDPSYKGEPSNAKLYTVNPCGKSDAELLSFEIPIKETQEEAECCYLIDGKWICW